jgi:deoxyribose-phosphate aldolase
LTQEEKIKLCELVSGSGADYIKTSTGFSTGGATREDIALMAQHVASGVKIKAAGGISSLEDAEEFLTLGADRLGTSRLVKLAQQ